MMDALLEGVGLKKSYPSGRGELAVLKGVDLRVERGEILVIVGPSGAGKSTLLYLLGGLDRPSQGEVRFEGKNLYAALNDRERSGVRNHQFGFVFQFYHLIPELTALENVLLPARMKRRALPLKALRQEANRLLQEVGLEERSHHQPAQLSGGEQQRVAIARSLMNRPTVVFCDEPTGNLDSKSGEEVLRLLLRMNREHRTTLVIVTHESAVQQMAGRLLSLRDGQLY